MNRKKLLIAGGLIGAIIVLVIGVFIFPFLGSKTTNSTVISNSTTNMSAGKYLSFDNSTPEATAISIARLNEGINGFVSDIVTANNASLTSDGNYWIVNMHTDGQDDWIVTIDAKTWMSKKNGGAEKPINTWRSLDELKAKYIAEIQANRGVVGNPCKLTTNDKEIWKVPVYEPLANWELFGYIYVDLKTGKSKDSTTEEGWMTLKEVDNSINKIDRGRTPFRDALRNLYPE